MVANDVRYDTKSVKAMRGTESRSISKWQKDGWELVSQDQATLHTTLNFRRAKRAVPWVPIAAGVLALALIGGVAAAVGASKGEDKPPATDAATTTPGLVEPTTEPTAVEPTATEPVRLTIANSPELLAVLMESDSCSDKVASFASTYSGQTIEFDGSVAAFANHGTYKTRYDILLAPGDKGSNSATGPSFKYDDVNFSDLHITGGESVGLDDLVHVVATVGDYKQASCLFFLEPVATRIR